MSILVQTNRMPQESLAVSRVWSEEVAICARGVCYTYGLGDAGTQVLFDNNLEVGQGEIVILTGPSGSGKTTLLTLIGALRSMQTGALRVLDRELAGMSSSEQVELRREIGFIFQHHNLFTSLSAIENVLMCAVLHLGSAAEIRERSRSMLASLGLGERLHHPPARLSGGQRQRVAIARALVNSPVLVLADEPTAALDAASGEIVMSLFRRLASGPSRSTILIVTHDQRVLDHADRIVNMVGGRIVSNVRPKKLVKILKAIALNKRLEGLAESTLARVAERMQVEARAAGETIVRAGESGDRIYVLGAGEATATSGDGIVRSLSVGESFGTISDFFHEPIGETVVSRTEVEVYLLLKNDFELVMATDKSFEERVQTYLMSRQI